MLEGGAWWGDGVVGVLVDTPEGCGYNTGSTRTHEVAFSCVMMESWGGVLSRQV